MEGDQVGNLPTSQPNDEASTKAPVNDKFAGQFLWPTRLIAARSRILSPHDWSTILIIFNFLIATVIALLLGPVQLVLLAASDDYTTITDGYFPVVLRISLMVSGVMAILTIVALIRLWNRQPKHTLFSIVLGAGSLLIYGLIWLAGFVISFKPNQLALVMIVAVILAWVAGHLALGQLIPPEDSLGTHKALVSILIVLASAELAFTGLYLINQSKDQVEVEQELLAMAEAQLAARKEGVSDFLSDLVVEACQSDYQVVYMPEGVNNTGLFECADTSVYSVTEPIDLPTETAAVALGQAFYFGKVHDDFVSEYFPSDLSIKYLYRDLKAANSPSELVLLVPATTEEGVIDGYIDRILGFVNNRDRSNALRLSIFYNEFLNEVESTKDFILISALETIEMNTYLPNGASVRGHLNGMYGTYLFTPDSALTALYSLAASPLLYPSQTRDALNSRRHISAIIEAEREYSADELRDVLWASWIDPAA